MAYIGKKPEDAFRGLAYYDTFTGDGSTTTFDLSADAPDGGQNDIVVVVDNVRQEPGASKSYTLGLDGSSRYRRITFNTAPDNLSEIYVINPGRSTQLNTVSDNAITTAKLYSEAVTTAKIAPAAITAPLMGPAAVGASNIAPGAITTTQISPSAAITNSQLANSSITINGNAVSLGGSITAGTDWQAVTVADGSTQLNAVAGKGYFLDTNAGVIEVFLPTSPTRGDTVILADYSGTFATNKVIVNTGGALIDSTEGGPDSSNDFELTTNNQVVELVYVDAAKGWLVKTNSTSSGLNVMPGEGGYGNTYITATGGTITTSGDYKIHKFTGDGCFVVSSGGGPLATVDYLVVAGGGGGGSGQCGSSISGAGGGAGGFRVSNSYGLPAPTTSPLASCTSLAVTVATYPITVGAGGTCAAKSPCVAIPGGSGSNSVFSTITSAGGGGGGGRSSGPSQTGLNGGSGGGTAGVCNIAGGTGNTPPVSPPQGNNGGRSATAPGTGNMSGGGGGAGAVGGDGTPGPSLGGIGSYVSPSFAVGSAGTTGPVCGVRYFSGGGGVGATPTNASTAGGSGGGGAGGPPSNAVGVSGTANTGGAGGGGSAGPLNGTSGAGGKGIVIIRYKFQ